MDFTAGYLSPTLQYQTHWIPHPPPAIQRLPANPVGIATLEVPATGSCYPTIVQVVTPYEKYTDSYSSINMQTTYYSERIRNPYQTELQTGKPPLRPCWDCLTPTDSLDYISNNTATVPLEDSVQWPFLHQTSLTSLSSVGSQSSSCEPASPRLWPEYRAPPVVHVAVMTPQAPEPVAEKTPISSPSMVYHKAPVFSEDHPEMAPRSGSHTISVQEPKPEPHEGTKPLIPHIPRLKPPGTEIARVPTKSCAPKEEHEKCSGSVAQASPILSSDCAKVSTTPLKGDSPCETPSTPVHRVDDDSIHGTPPPMAVSVPTGGMPQPRRARHSIQLWPEALDAARIEISPPSPAKGISPPASAPKESPPPERPAPRSPLPSPPAVAWPIPPGVNPTGWVLPINVSADIQSPGLLTPNSVQSPLASPPPRHVHQPLKQHRERPSPVSHGLPMNLEALEEMSPTLRHRGLTVQLGTPRRVAMLNSSLAASPITPSQARDNGAASPINSTPSSHEASPSFRAAIRQALRIDKIKALSPGSRPLSPAARAISLSLRTLSPTARPPSSPSRTRSPFARVLSPKNGKSNGLTMGNLSGMSGLLSPRAKVNAHEELPEEDRIELQQDSTQSALLFKGKEETTESNKKVLGLQDFELIRVIGQGQFGKVWKVKHNDTVYAMKAIRKDFFDKKNMFGLLKNERALLASIQHPFITSLKYAFQTPQRAFLVMDYIPGGEMGYHLNRDSRQFWDEDRVRLYTAQLVLALEHLHQLGVIHRDLKIDNVLFDAEGHAILIDLGLAKKLQDGVEKGSSKYLGICNLYFSPEMLRGEDFGFESDWWALGVLVYGLLMGSVPFPAPSLLAMQTLIMGEKELEIPEARHLSYTCAHFVKSILAKPLHKRLKTAADIKAHPWFADLDWDMVYQKKIPMPWCPPDESEEDDEVSNAAMSYCVPPTRDIELHNFSFVWTPRMDPLCLDAEYRTLML